MKTLLPTALPLLALLLLAGPVLTSTAQTATWVGSASGNWSDPANWESGTLPAAGFDVVLRDTSHPGVGFNPLSNDLSSLELNSVRFDLTPTSPNYLVAGNPITLSASAPSINVVSATGSGAGNYNITVGFNLDLHIPQAASMNAARWGSGGTRLLNLELNGVVSGSGALTTVGGDPIWFNNPGNTRTGNLTINGGNQTIRLNSYGSTDPLAVVQIQNNNSGLAFAGSTAATLPIDVRWGNQNNHRIENLGTGTFTIGGGITTSAQDVRNLRLRPVSGDIVVAGPITTTHANARANEIKGITVQGTSGARTVTFESGGDYTGPTFLLTGASNNTPTLALVGSADLPQTEGIYLGRYTTFDVSGRSDGTFTLRTNENGSPQRLVGRGTVQGTIATAGPENSLQPAEVGGTTTGSALPLLAESGWGQPLSIGSLDATAGATFVFDLGTANQSLLNIANLFVGSSNPGQLRFLFSGDAILEDSSFTLINFSLSSGLETTDFSALGGVPEGLHPLFLIDANSVSVTFVPEPALFASLAGLAALLLAFRRHRSSPQA